MGWWTLCCYMSDIKKDSKIINIVIIDQITLAPITCIFTAAIERCFPHEIRLISVIRNIYCYTTSISKWKEVYGLFDYTETHFGYIDQNPKADSGMIHAAWTNTRSKFNIRRLTNSTSTIGIIVGHQSIEPWSGIFIALLITEAVRQNSWWPKR